MKYLAIFLVLLLACSTALKPSEPQPVSQAEVEAEEQVTRPAQDLTEPVPATPPAQERIPEPYSKLGCEQLLTPEQFASACGKMVSELVVTSKIGTRNCFINIRDRRNERLTAGITLTAMDDEKTAKKEFERRAAVVKQEMSSAAGEQAYFFPKLERQTITFLRGNYIVEVGADTKLCDDEKLPSLARTVDSRLS